MRKLVASLLVVVVIGWAYVAYTQSQAVHIHYRLEVVLEVNGERRQFSTVQLLVLAESAFHTAGANPIQRTIYGQALVIQITGTDLILVPMMSTAYGKGGNAVPYSDLFTHACGLEKTLSVLGESYREYLTSLDEFSGRCRVPKAAYPVFAGLPAPKTRDGAYYIDPFRFGETPFQNVRLIDIFVETTDEPVSSDIAQVLPWIDELEGTDKVGALSLKHNSRTIPISIYSLERRLKKWL